MLAIDHLGSGWSIDAQALPAPRDFSITADQDFAALAERIGPPGTLGCGPQHGAFVVLSLVPRRLGRAANLAMFFHLIVMFAQGLQQFVG